ncbi:MAG: efflux RND transporter permease subunit [Pseudomonadales bacterium]|jgi:multidrug efflux pump|nr:efflux RND transporter permease subunit [Pseudomonadales bacterium]MCP5319359.1 efflux RND transporter permease subunit [Pseudomonadales bacterium]MCP5336898.1 efflux RND transporter permease subunit [Pseudomonadales bacterium]
MKFTDIFIRRPVLAGVVSLVIVLLGLRAYGSLSLREYPEITYPVIMVTTPYPGANADLIQGFITRPLERAIATAEGLDYVEARSADGVSRISAHLRPGYDIDAAFVDITAKVAQQRRELPLDAEDTIVAKDMGMGGNELMFLAFSSKVLSLEQITDYLDRVVVPVLSTAKGVGEARIDGGRRFAMRVWIDPERLAAFGLTASDVLQAIRRNNVQSAAGEIRSDYVKLYLNPQTVIDDVEGFRRLVLHRGADSVIRLGDVARIEMGAESYDQSTSDQGRQAVFVAVSSALTANPLEVGRNIRELMPLIISQLPDGLQGAVVFDATQTIQSSINEVVTTLLEASLIVVLVIFLFLGSLRSVLIPVVTIPLSLVGVLSLMLWMGFSVNLLTLLAMVLAIGLVVDDAIVVVENIQRHLEEGMKPLEAALQGAREIAYPVVVMTLTLAAVYAPIGFLGGLTGTLFIEFAFTLAGAVIVSGVIALTLSPMMCSRLLRHEDSSSGFARWLERAFSALKRHYERVLRYAMANRPIVLVFAAAVFVSLFFLFRAIPQELAPLEDTGHVYIVGEAPFNSTLEYTQAYTTQVEQVMRETPEYKRHFLVTGIMGTNTFFGMTELLPWKERSRDAQQVQQDLTARMASIAGVRINAFNMPSIPGASPELPIRYVIATTGSYELLQQVASEIESKARASGKFVYVQSDLRFEKPELLIEIDRDKAARLGIDVAEIGTTLATFLNESESSRFSVDSRSYEIILQVERAQRSSAKNLDSYYVRTASGGLVPLSAVVSKVRRNRPGSLTEYQQLNSAVIGALPSPGVSLGDGVDWFNEQARPLLPAGYSADYLGQSRQFVTEGNVLLWTFLFSFVLIFLVLAAQFESFTDPLTVLVSVPLSVCGALIPLALGLATMNIYTQVGLLTLIGLISKHGILIVDFANRQQEFHGSSVIDAVVEAATVRLRPILMTTAAMVFGVIPLLLASGAGAQARTSIGIVITFGMLVGTLFTLFVVPVIYSYVARRHAAVTAEPAASH